jgi:hypothetical protein
MEGFVYGATAAGIFFICMMMFSLAGIAEGGV